MGYTIYSNCIGTFVFKDKQLAEEILFKKNEVLKYASLIEKKDELFTEKELSKKYKGADIVEKGKSPPAWVLEFLCQKKYLTKMREALIVITKRRVAETLKPDHLIIQASNNIEELDKVANNLSKRLREWYELYNPEFSKSLENHEKFSQLIQIKSKKELLKEIGMTEAESMGADFSKKDLQPVLDLAAQIESLYALRESQAKYVEEAMREHMPNISAIAGPMIAAKLLSIAGSLEKMSLFPASTLQLLGAEKALFRHIKTGARSPKFGFIINHPLVAKARTDAKGKAARMVSDKLSIAAKVDFFKGEFVGNRLRKELEEKLK